MYHFFINFYFVGDDDAPIVTIVANPPGTQVDGQPNTYDYPVVSSVTLICVVTTPPDGSTMTVDSYSWNAINCYNHPYRGGVDDPCFYSGGCTGQNITGYDLQAPDAGTVTCTAIIGGNNCTSSPLTLRISGEHCEV